MSAVHEREAAPDIFARIFNLLSSMKLGFCVFVSSAAVFAVATIVWEEPEAVVKNVPWVRFGIEALLVFLALHLFAAALAGYPWNRRSIGLLAARAGVLVAFAGALITTRFGREGTIAMTEGERRESYLTGRDLLSVQAPGPDGHGLVPRENFPLQGLVGTSRGTSRDLEFPLDDGSRVLVDRYYARYASRKVWAEGGEEPRPDPALEIVVATGGQESTQLLPALQAAVLGTDRLVVFVPFVDAEIERIVATRRREARAGTLVVETPGGEPRKLDVLDSLRKPVPLGDGYTLSVEQYSPNLVVRDNAAANEGDRPLNPAVHIRVTGPDSFDRTEWLFPEKEAPAALGRIGLDDRFRFSYDFGERLTNVYLLKRDAGVEFVIAAPGAEPKRTLQGPGGRVAIGEGFELSVTRVFANAVETEEAANDGAEKVAAIHVVWQGKGGQDEAWIPFGSTVRLTAGESSAWFQYTRSLAALPFQLELRESTATGSRIAFRVGSGPESERWIAVNEPLELADPDWGTWRIGLLPEPPAQGTSPTFFVSYDPGRPVVLAGSLAVCAGVFFMFWIRPFLRKSQGEDVAP
ncbi:MAG: hypothetical protein HYY18_13875 [Planctomycetes bacterium]|nr:hypothetical protein [Planctomycetota bacterium]